MDAERIARCGLRLHSRIPLLNIVLRRSACRQLAADSGPATVPHLRRALASDDARVRQTAEAALRGLKDPGAVDALCGLWARGRDEALGRIIAECGHVAARPVKVRVLAALKAGKLDKCGESAEAVPCLLDARRDRDPAMAQNAEAALRLLRVQTAVDALCGRWARGRDEALGRIIAECGYVAEQPLKVRVLSALQADKGPSVVENPASLQELLTALQDGNNTLAARADRVLRGLTDPKARAALCRLAMNDPSGAVANICVACGYRPPGDPEECSLYLFVTRQLEEYFKEDYEFQNLRLAYERADAAVQARVMEVVRSGDKRCVGFLLGPGGPGGGVRRKLSECTDREVALAIESGLRHRDWPRLFAAFLHLPLKYGFPLLKNFRTSGWQPEEEEMRQLYGRLLLAIEENPRSLPPLEQGDWSEEWPFERWVRQGLAGPLAKENEKSLLQRLETADPPEGVALVAALSRTCGLGSVASEKVGQNPHPLIRMAGIVTGLCPPTGKEEWLADFTGEEEFWPDRATPPDLDIIRLFPRGWGMGHIGAMRRVLELLIAHRLENSATFDLVIDEAGEFAGEFEEAE